MKTIRIAIVLLALVMLTTVSASAYSSKLINTGFDDWDGTALVGWGVAGIVMEGSAPNGSSVILGDSSSIYQHYDANYGYEFTVHYRGYCRVMNQYYQSEDWNYGYGEFMPVSLDRSSVLLVGVEDCEIDYIDLYEFGHLEDGGYFYSAIFALAIFLLHSMTGIYAFGFLIVCMLMKHQGIVIVGDITWMTDINIILFLLIPVAIYRRIHKD